MIAGFKLATNRKQSWWTCSGELFKPFMLISVQEAARQTACHNEGLYNCLHGLQRMMCLGKFSEQRTSHLSQGREKWNIQLEWYIENPSVKRLFQREVKDVDYLDLVNPWLGRDVFKESACSIVIHRLFSSAYRPSNFNMIQFVKEAAKI